MGQAPSVHVGPPGERKSFRGILRSPFPKRRHRSKAPLSAACNFVETDQKIDQLNINTVTEEELMTLPGINRSVANKIVEYRQLIGRFKRVDDLALVSGIGAERLDSIRPEICVNRRRNTSCASSRAQSIDSLQSTETSRLGLRTSQTRLVNINTANVFDLMSVQGLNQELAANIVLYREQRGCLQNIDELIKVKGIKHWRLGALRTQLYAGSQQTSPIKPVNGVKPSGPTQFQNGKLGHRKTMSVPISNGLLPNKDIFELLSAYSQRPIQEDDFNYERNGRPALRIATWNLHNFTLDKSCNPGVQETVCRTILENKFSIIAVQEIIDPLGLKKICEELNNPVLKRVVDWKDNNRKWKMSDVSNGLAFIYDSSCDVELTADNELAFQACEEELMAGVATFQLKDFSVSLLNVCLYNIINADDGISNSIAKAIEGHIQETDVLVILGDFSGCNLSQTTVEGALEQVKYSGILPLTASTHYYNGGKFFDNIYIDQETQPQFTGIHGVVKKGMTHLAIPQGWMWGGAASDHCPVWCEIYSNKADYKVVCDG